MKYIVIQTIIILGAFTSIISGQSTIENDKLKFWHPDLKLSPQDFKADTSQAFNNLNQKYGMQAYSFSILRSILDVPKKKRERGTKLEKVYIAPCIDKYQSVSITEDSVEMLKQEMFIDITELFARKARQEFKKHRDTIGNVYGVYWNLYSTVISDICKRKNEMIDAYVAEVIIFKKEGAYEKWRTQIDALLAEIRDFMTKPEDCVRFLSGKPLTEDYIMSPNYLGEIKCDKKK